jgi:hypothetical protein
VHEADVGGGGLGDQIRHPLGDAVEVEPCRQDLDHPMQQLGVGI